ncbi:MAG: hypothetical protein AVDCRST_MAG25-3636, partial [uncultured Rubrobacteraceae bacterium]
WERSSASRSRCPCFPGTSSGSPPTASTPPRSGRSAATGPSAPSPSTSASPATHTARRGSPSAPAYCSISRPPGCWSAGCSC